jgi:hypothetical protein
MLDKDFFDEEFFTQHIGKIINLIVMDFFINKDTIKPFENSTMKTTFF